jgi:hypothetical protein
MYLILYLVGTIKVLDLIEFSLLILMLLLIDKQSIPVGYHSQVVRAQTHLSDG